MKARDLRLVLPALAVWSSALLCVFVPAVAWGCAGGCLLACATVVVLLAARQRGRGCAPRSRLLPGGLAAIALAAAAGAALSVALALPSREHASAWDGRVVEVEAEITSSGSIGRDGRLWVEALATGIGPPGSPAAAATPIRVGVESGAGFDLGARIRVVGEASATDAGERSALVVFASEAEISAPASGVFGMAATAKEMFTERSLRLPEPGAGLLPGLAVGDTRAVSTTLNDDMRTSGLSHLTAVSGENYAIASWVV